MPTMILRTRVDRRNATEARRVLALLGMTPTDAVNVFFAQVASRKAIPFAIATADSDYAAEEYGLTKAGIAATSRRISRATARAREAGTVREATGIDSLRE